MEASDLLPVRLRMRTWKLASRSSLRIAGPRLPVAPARATVSLEDMMRVVSGWRIYLCCCFLDLLRY